jgi:hypothetical protein
MTDFKKGGPLQNSNIYATNRLFVKNPLFKKKKKKRAPGVYNPKGKFKYEDGGDISIPELNKGGKPCPPGQQYNPYTKRCEAKLEDRTFLNLMRDRKYGSLQQFKQAPKSSYNPEYIQNLKEFTITASKKAKAKKNKKKTDTFNSDYEKLVEQYDKLRNSPLLANQEKAEGLLRQIKEIELYTPPKNQISFEGDAVEDFINKNILDDAMGKASVSAAATVGEDEDEIDNFRHPQAGRYAAEAIVNYFPEWAQYTGIPQTAGLWGANAMGVGHELGTIFGDPRWFDDTYPDNKAPGFLEKAKMILGESGEDIFNNAVGAGVGVLPMNSRDKTNTLLELSNQNMLPDGIVRRNPANNLYLKKGPNDPGKFKSPYKQELGGSIVDLTEEEIQKYIDGGYVVEEINDPSIPKLDRLKPGGAPCPRGQMRDALGKCVPYNWGSGNIQAADSYTGMYGGYDASGTKNLTEVKASAKKGKKLSDYILRGGKTKADEARKLGKNAGQYFGMPGENLEPVNFTKAGLEKYKKEIKDAKKNYEAEEKNKAEYEKARKKLEKSKDQSAGTKFRQEYEKKGWDRFDPNLMKEGYKGQFQDAVDEANARKTENYNLVRDTAAELSGIASAHRVYEDPLGTLKGVGQSMGDITTLPLGLGQGVYNYANTGNFDMGVNPLTGSNYGEGFDETMDVIGVAGLIAPGLSGLKFAKAGDLFSDVGRGFKTLSKGKPQGSILTKYRNIEELRHAKGYKNFKAANEAYPELFPTEESFMQAQNEANALLKEYKPKFEKQFGKGKDDEILVFGAHDDVGKLNSKEGFLVDDEFAKSTGLENDLTNQQKFLGDTYQLEYSGYFNQNPGYGGNKEFAKYLSDQIEPVIGANKLKAPAQVRRTSSFNRPVKTMRGDQELTLNYDDLLEGDIIYPEHNWSTTTDMTGNVWGSGDPTSKVAIINVPEGQSAFRPNMYTGSQYVAEQELLLPSKLGYKVSGVNTKGFGSDSPRFIFDVHNPYKQGGATDDYIEVDIPEKEIQWYIDNGYRVEPVTKLKKFIG